LWLRQASAASKGLARGGPDSDFYRGKIQAAAHWFHAEVPRVHLLAEQCLHDESYARMRDAWF
jgi:hypothetical protein